MQRLVDAVDCLARPLRCAVMVHWTGLQSGPRPRPCLRLPWRLLHEETDLTQKTGQSPAWKPLKAGAGCRRDCWWRKARGVGISRQHEKAHQGIHANLVCSEPKVVNLKIWGLCSDGADGETRYCFAI
jgi:hypothetical protein